MLARAAEPQPDHRGDPGRRRRVLGRQAVAFFESVADAVSDALVVTNSRGKIAFVNRQACDTFG
jgi:PAS domain-containing protein